jgi:DNA polymerase III subunit chi
VAEVVFFTGVVDVIDFAARLLRKKYREAARLAVYGPPAVLQRLDQALWIADPLDFTPHVLLHPGAALPVPAVAARTLLWLLPEPQPILGCDTGINLGRDDLDLAAVHERVAEVVSIADAERAAGRSRWKRYEANGHKLVHHPQG